MNFFDKLQASILQNHSLLFVSLDPNPELLPAHYTSEDIIANLHNWLEFIIRETSDYVCAYKPTFGLYQALGIPGLELLENTLAIIPSHIPVILDAKHSDLNSSTVFAHRVFTQLNVDAVTLSPYTGQDHVAPFLVYPDKAVFILCSTSNPGAEAWAAENAWFGNDSAMTYTAFDLHKKLVEEEGYDPKSDDYYEEIDKRIRLEFPHKFDSNEGSTEKVVQEQRKPAQTVASARRPATTGRAKTVKLTPSQVAIAKKLGVPLEDYARQLQLTKEV